MDQAFYRVAINVFDLKTGSDAFEDPTISLVVSEYTASLITRILADHMGKAAQARLDTFEPEEVEFEPEEDEENDGIPF